MTKEIETKRDYLVVRGNELIQKSKFELSLMEQKTISYICSMIKPVINSVYQLEYEFNISEYCKICGIDYTSGKNYSAIKDTLKRLSDRSMWLEIGEQEVLCRWLSKTWINKRKGIVKVRLDDDLVPYLFDLGQRFTQYQLYNILAMKSAFSVRIYELMKSYEFRKEIVFDIEELKEKLCVADVKSYYRFPDFRRKVLEKAQEEINELSDIEINFETITKGRKVVQVKFEIKTKTPIQKYLTRQKTSGLLNERGE